MVAVIVLGGSVVGLGAGRPALACSCVGLTDNEAFTAAEAVFTADSVEIQTRGDPHLSSELETFVFDVDAVYKGEVSARQPVLTAKGGESCGLEIAGRGRFVVYATTRDPSGGSFDGELYSDLCSGTRSLSERALPGRFGKGQPPAPRLVGEIATSQQRPVAGAEEPVSPGSSGVAIWQVLTVAVAAIAVGLLCHRLRRRQLSTQASP